MCVPISTDPGRHRRWLVDMLVVGVIAGGWWLVSSLLVSGSRSLVVGGCMFLFQQIPVDIAGGWWM